MARTDSQNVSSPQPNLAGNGATESPAEPRRKRKSISTVPTERPDWLPSNWVVEDRMRTSGATAGSVDKYYFDPASGHRFRSKIEAIYFLENGSVRKRKMSENSESDATGQKQKKSSTKTKNAPPLNFDFHNAPETIKWVLTDSADGTWAPFAGEAQVLKSTKQQWLAAFTSLALKNGGRITF